MVDSDAVVRASVDREAGNEDIPDPDPPLSSCLCLVMINDSHVDVYTWWDSFETAPVTGSLLSVAADRCLAGFGDLFLRLVNSSARTIRWEPCASEMATGSGRPPLDRSGVNLQVNIDVPWNAP